MKNYIGSETPTYLLPEAQHRTPEAPPRPTSDKGTSPNIEGKSKWERMADKQIREDPFQTRTTSSREFEEAKLMRKRLEGRIGTSE